MKEKKFTWGTALTISSGMFGALMGAGAGTGTIFLVYCLNAGGLWSPLHMVVNITSLFLMFFLCISVCRKYNLKSYPEMMNKIWGKAGKAIGPISYLCMIFCYMVYIIAVLAGAASLAESFGVSAEVGIVICAVLSILVVFKGTETFNRISTVLAIPMFLIITLTYLISFLGYGGVERLQELIATGWKPEGYTNGFYGLQMAMFLCFGNIPYVSIYLLNMDKMKTQRNINMAMLVGWILCGVTFVLPPICLLGFVPEVIESGMPLMYLLTEVIDFPPALLIYFILMCFALVSTGASTLIVLGDEGTNWCNRLKLNWNPTLKKIIIPIVACIVAYPISRSGIMNTMSTVSVALGIVNAFMVFLPILIRGIILMVKKKPAEDAVTKA